MNNLMLKRKKKFHSQRRHSRGKNVRKFIENHGLSFSRVFSSVALKISFGPFGFGHSGRSETRSRDFESCSRESKNERMAQDRKRRNAR